MIGHQLLQMSTTNSALSKRFKSVYLISANAQVTEYKDRNMECQASGTTCSRRVSTVHLTPFDACSSVAVIEAMPAILFLAHTPENKLNQFRSAEGDRFRF